MSPPPTTIGQRLKLAREAKRIGVNEASRVTKIQKRLIEAMEEDQVEEILDPTYTKIFIKKYASYLGMDSSALFQEYATVNHSAAAPAEPEITLKTEVTQEKEKSVSYAQTLATMAVIVAALVGVAFLGYLSVDVLGKAGKSQSSQPRATHAAPKKPVPPKKNLLVPSSKPLKLTITTTADVWMQVKSDGAIIFQNVLTKGSKESWIAKNELELWTGNAGAMQLNLNGKPLEGMGKGVRKGVKITHAGIE